MLSIKANIYLKKTEEAGGMNRPGFSGMQPSFNVESELIMCRIFEISGKEEMPLGNEYEVRIDLPYGEQYSSYIVPEYKFFLNIGGNIIGRGIVEKILDWSHIPQRNILNLSNFK